MSRQTCSCCSASYTTKAPRLAIIDAVWFDPNRFPDLGLCPSCLRLDRDATRQDIVDNIVDFSADRVAATTDDSAWTYLSVRGIPLPPLSCVAEDPEQLSHILQETQLPLNQWLQLAE